MNDRMSNIGRLVAGLLIGVAVGSAVAMFATPRSGMETRRLVRRKSLELRDKAGDAIGKARVQTTKFINNTRQNANQMIRREQKRTRKA